MRPTDVSEYLQFAINNRFPILIKGKPGIGKSDIVQQAANATKSELILSHPVVSDPTDYKGLPFPKKDGTADFLPFGDLQKIITAKEKTVFFLDDLGQAPASVQAACMQLLLARRINNHIVSDHVTFLAATNRREDKAAVNGILEPVKSRFSAIIDLEVNTEDWVKWALAHDMPTELIAFVRFRSTLFDNSEPSRDIVNTISPRTVAAVGKQQVAGLAEKFEFEAFNGAAGQVFATEYRAFLNIFRNLPSLDQIILNPDTVKLPKTPDLLYATTCALAKRMNDQNIGSICTYLDRLAPEFSVACMKDASARNEAICNNREFIKWGSDHADIFL